MTWKRGSLKKRGRESLQAMNPHPLCLDPILSPAHLPKSRLKRNPRRTFFRIGVIESAFATIRPCGTLRAEEPMPTTLVDATLALLRLYAERQGEIPSMIPPTRCFACPSRRFCAQALLRE